MSRVSNPNWALTWNIFAIPLGSWSATPDTMAGKEHHPNPAVREGHLYIQEGGTHY
jgi:hypothetical protein